MLTLINSDSNILQNPIELQLFLRQAIQFAIVMFDDKFFIFFLFLFQVGPSSNVTHMVSQNTRRSINICGVAIEFCIGHPLQPLQDIGGYVSQLYSSTLKKWIHTQPIPQSYIIFVVVLLEEFLCVIYHSGAKPDRQQKNLPEIRLYHCMIAYLKEQK